MQRFELRGVPLSLARDNWWLTPESGAAEAPPARSGGALSPSGVPGGALGLILLLALGDFLFWRETPGLSLAIFALALVAVAGHSKPLAVRLRAQAICLIGALPVVVYLQPLSLAFLLSGVIAAIVLLSRQASGRSFLPGIADFLVALPERWLAATGLLWWPLPGQAARASRQMSAAAMRGSWLRDWAFPIGGSLVFLALLLDANPLFLHLGREALDPWSLILRLIFWVGLAILILPFLSGTAAPPVTRLPGRLVLRLPGLNPRSVLRALILFNLLIGVQILSDASILLGGASLPEGVSYSLYAHRGVWPLLAAVMLAGGFTLAARPFLQEHRAIRPLLLLWLALNVALTVAAAKRLDLYIDTYGLTFLRLYALLWMGLVAFGLVLMAWQVLAIRSNSWLMFRLFMYAVAMLYTASFINITAIIAAQNLGRDDPDLPYLCSLGPMAAAELIPSEQWRDQITMRPGSCAAIRAPRISGWRDWGFRSASVLRKLEAADLTRMEGEAG